MRKTFRTACRDCRKQEDVAGTRSAVAVIKIDRAGAGSHGVPCREEVVADDIAPAGWVASLVDGPAVGLVTTLRDDVELEHVIIPADQHGLVRGIDEVVGRAGSPTPSNTPRTHQ